MAKNITRVLWEASNIPSGLSFNTANGTFSGTPDEAGEYDVPVKVETNYGSDEKYVHISVAEKVHWEKLTMYYPLRPNQPVLFAQYYNRLENV